VIPRPIPLGIAGDSGAGKTTLIRGLVRILGEQRVSHVQPTTASAPTTAGARSRRSRRSTGAPTVAILEQRRREIDAAGAAAAAADRAAGAGTAALPSPNRATSSSCRLVGVETDAVPPT
jgi:molybdopterin-guanine dinucleotide biosynthesis protein